jgi:hypothetical protein
VLAWEAAGASHAIRVTTFRDHHVSSKRFKMKVVVVTETGQGRFQPEVRTGSYLLLVDEPMGVGGLDSGPGPYDLSPRSAPAAR